MSDPAAFRAQFPVCSKLAYLNAGTEGPIPQTAADAVNRRVALDLANGRCGHAYHEQVNELAASLRAGYASVLGCAPADVALTGATTDGCNTVISGLSWDAGDEVLTSDQEHPGLLAPLRRLRDRHGVSIRVVPFAELTQSVAGNTKLIACSHVSWATGGIVDVAALRSTGVPVLLDAAQALGAIPVDVTALGVDFYAASGQKWLCGPEGSGCLYVRPDRLDDLDPPWPGYSTLADASDPLSSGLAETTARLENSFPSVLRGVWALASLDTFAAAGWEWVHERAASLAEMLAGRFRQAGITVAPRGPSTLVSWSVADPQAEVERLAAAGVLVRSIPVGGMMRASVGAWSSEEELEQLVELTLRD